MPVSWPVLLSVAAPFIVALAILGRWLMEHLDRAHAEIQRLNDRMVDQTIPAISTSTAATQAALDLIRRIDEELKAERDLRVRFEERLHLGGPTRGGNP